MDKHLLHFQNFLSFIKKKYKDNDKKLYIAKNGSKIHPTCISQIV